MMGAIAVTRFGLGARPNEIVSASSDPQAWLSAQLRPFTDGEAPRDDGASAAQRVALLDDYRRARAAERKTADDKQEDGSALPSQKALRELVAADFLARAQLFATTPFGFRERWTLFWANHFTVSATKLASSVLVGPFEREAIRPYVFGRFEDMLIAASTHAGMMTYLDQIQSIGPESAAARILSRRQAGKRKPGLNENLAREILELHTLGVGSGYSQTDVTEFARALTGFSLGRREDERAGQFVFRAGAHEPGARTILGRKYPEGGIDQGLAVLKALAADPRTARHVCTKLARHFVSDTPPPQLVDRLTAQWLESSGQLAAVARTLIAAPEAWNPAPAKFKTPYEFTLSTWRLVGAEPSSIERLAPVLTGLGQKPFSAPSPKGWPEEAQAWASPDGLIKRMQWSQGIAAVVGDRADPNVTAREALGPRLSTDVARAIARAETRREAFAILLMSPEFQRR
jgi:uncharacterized protein (DUF1800 family)